MSGDTVERVRERAGSTRVDAVPLSPSSVKNRQRFNGVLYPKAYRRHQGGAESSAMQTECLVLGDERTTLANGRRGFLS